MASIQLAIAPLIMILSLISIQMADAQAPAEESCISNLVPCVNYLNATTKPPSSCCDPLRVAVTKQLDCLCNIYKNPDLTKTFNVNVTQALALPGLCGIPGNVAECNKASAPSSPSSSNKSPVTTPNGKKSNGVKGIACTGLSISLVLGASLMLW